jgi:hypothetical protein
MRQLRVYSLIFILFFAIKTQAQQHTDSVKPLFKMLDSVEISAF